ncbi:hypothetical protein K431DRAFT_33349 [Polychaeton citri CBS 116435]|uniref:Ubiquitin-conjugating enzyme E2C-binding protein n=1 Tax=Polychaeton citri CBS 116435 TaxID=1314669 RepID=A0A9P4QB17_9PEZI|nr:hypothetical protein K431DRAFT_33349 [Polychaeton citri CBS 116435]
MPIHLYVEHLLNIRSLSIQASLSTTTNEETNAELSADHRKLTLTHDGQSATVELPINVPGRGKVTLTLPAVPTKELSFRLSVEEKAESQGLLGGLQRSEANIVPWTATSLSEHTEVYCKACGSVIVARGSIVTWKNLPSEGWAEMMEFWHCHKPDEPHDHAQDFDSSTKGYAAQSRLSVEPSVGLVGALDFTFALSDCKNIEVGSTCLRFTCAVHYSHHIPRFPGTKEPALSDLQVKFRESVGIQSPQINEPSVENRRQPCGSEGGPCNPY